MTISIAVNGRELFEWDGDAEAIGELDEGMREVARGGPPTPEQLADSAVAHVLKHGSIQSRREREWMMPVLVWMLLSKPTGHPDHPGCYRDYVAMWDFSFDFSRGSDPKRISVAVEGKMQGGDRWNGLN
jgi:hypothetical protein